MGNKKSYGSNVCYTIIDYKTDIKKYTVYVSYIHEWDNNFGADRDGLRGSKRECIYIESIDRIESKKRVIPIERISKKYLENMIESLEEKILDRYY